MALYRDDNFLKRCRRRYREYGGPNLVFAQNSDRSGSVCLAPKPERWPPAAIDMELALTMFLKDAKTRFEPQGRVDCCGTGRRSCDCTHQGAGTGREK